MQTTLNKLIVQQKGKILGLESKGKLKRRLLDMGFVKGVVVQLIKTAPLGDPIEVKLKDYSITLRKEEAKDVLVDIS